MSATWIYVSDNIEPMNVTHPISEKILKRIRARNGAVPTKDLLDLGERAAVDQALSRLVRRGKLRRIGRGLFELPRMSKLLNRPRVGSPDELVRAWARNNGLAVVPSGAHAANILGLSTQVPAKIVYYTNGRTQTIQLGPYKIRLLNRGPRTMEISGNTAPLVFQALRYLGRDGVSRDDVQHLRSSLSKKDKTELRNNRRHASAWMQSVIDEIVGEEDNGWIESHS